MAEVRKRTERTVVCHDEWCGREWMVVVRCGGDGALGSMGYDGGVGGVTGVEGIVKCGGE